MFTVDHGEMLGERGMWFKFNPYEQTIKVPLIVHAPGAPAARRVRENCSLVDLLPTLLGLPTAPSHSVLSPAFKGALSPTASSPTCWPANAAGSFCTAP